MVALVLVARGDLPREECRAQDLPLRVWIEVAGQFHPESSHQLNSKLGCKPGHFFRPLNCCGLRFVLDQRLACSSLSNIQLSSDKAATFALRLARTASRSSALPHRLVQPIYRMVEHAHTFRLCWHTVLVDAVLLYGLCQALPLL